MAENQSPVEAFNPANDILKLLKTTPSEKISIVKNLIAWVTKKSTYDVTEDMASRVPSMRQYVWKKRDSLTFSDEKKEEYKISTDSWEIPLDFMDKGRMIILFLKD